MRLDDLTLDDFDGARIKKADTVAALFTASWCPFCVGFNPIFEKALDGTSFFAARVDMSDLSNPLWDIFGIGVVPTIILFKDGKAVWRKDGILGRGLSKDAVDELVRQSGLAH